MLIDADNVSSSHAAALLAELARHGAPTVKRAYGDWTTQQLTGWKRELARHAIAPIPAVRQHRRQELHRLGADHRRDGPALLGQPRRLRDRVRATATSPGSPPACASPGRPSHGLGQRKTLRPSRRRATSSSSSRCWARTTTTTVLRTTTRTPRATRSPTCRRSCTPPCSAPPRTTAGPRSGRSAPTSGRPTSFDPRHYGFPRLSAPPALRTTSTSTTPTAASPASASAPSARPKRAASTEGSGLGGRAGRPDREGHEGHEGREEDRGAGLTPSRRAGSGNDHGAAVRDRLRRDGHQGARRPGDREFAAERVRIRTRRSRRPTTWPRSSPTSRAVPGLPGAVGVTVPGVVRRRGALGGQHRQVLGRHRRRPGVHRGDRARGARRQRRRRGQARGGAVYAARGRAGLVIVTTLGTGIGSAMVHDGVLVPNSELGHLEIDGRRGVPAANSAREREDLSWHHWAKRLTTYRTLERLFSPELFVVGGRVSRTASTSCPCSTSTPRSCRRPCSTRRAWSARRSTRARAAA